MIFLKKAPIISISNNAVVVESSDEKYLIYLNTNETLTLPRDTDLYLDGRGKLYIVDEECLKIMDLKTRNIIQPKGRNLDQESFCPYDNIIGVVNGKILTDNEDKPQFIRLIDPNVNYNFDTLANSTIAVSDEEDLYVDYNKNIIIYYNAQRAIRWKM